mmetsp:Transcript_8120/g.12493  ORF Transcript_8120/g.12493 Transcript_8120/m.12493 type:complete len:84 (+) Transcript_8120:341-592(+)
MVILGIIRTACIPEIIFAVAVLVLKKQQDMFSDISKLDHLVVVSIFQTINLPPEQKRKSCKSQKQSKLFMTVTTVETKEELID